MEEYFQMNLFIFVDAGPFLFLHVNPTGNIHTYLGGIMEGKVVVGHNVIRQNVEQTKCITNKISNKQNIKQTKCRQT